MKIKKYFFPPDEYKFRWELRLEILWDNYPGLEGGFYANKWGGRVWFQVWKYSISLSFCPRSAEG